jgi:hypothetical protein
VRFSVNAEERALLSKKRFGRMWRNIWFGGGEAINPSVRDIVERSQTVYVGSRYHSPPPLSTLSLLQQYPAVEFSSF